MKSTTNTPEVWRACPSRAFIINELCGTIKSESDDYYLVQFEFGQLSALKSNTFDNKGATFYKGKR